MHGHLNELIKWMNSHKRPHTDPKYSPPSVLNNNEIEGSQGDAKVLSKQALPIKIFSSQPPYLLPCSIILLSLSDLEASFIASEISCVALSVFYTFGVGQKHSNVNKAFTSTAVPPSHLTDTSLSTSMLGCRSCAMRPRLV